MSQARAVRVVAATVLICSAVSAVLVVGYPLVLLHRPRVVIPLLMGLAVQSPAVLGAVILWRRPQVRVGWVLLLTGLVTSLATVGSVVSTTELQRALNEGTPPADLSELAAWSVLTNGFFPVVYAWPVLAALSFPDQRLHRPARVVMVGIAVCASVIAVLFALAPTANDPYGQVPNALARPGLISYTPAIDVLFAVAWLGLLAGIIGGTVLACGYAVRSTGELRLQRLWLGFGAALSAVALITCGLGTALGLIDTRWTEIVVFTVQVAVTATIAVAISRHGLYGIERLINRTFVYVGVTLVLAAGFLGLTAGLGLALGRDRPLVTAVATAGAAALFVPVRRLVQAQVDRRLAPRTVVATRVVRQVADRMQHDPLAPTAVQDALRVALDDQTLVVALRGREHWHTVDGDPVDSLAEPVPGRVVDQVHYAGVLVAAIDRATALTYRPELLRRVLAEAAAPLAVMRNSQELERQLTEVRASRARIVHAGFEARRQLERDLHDGAQQRLVALGISLRRAQGGLDGGSDGLRQQLDDAVEQVSDAIADLRGIAAGVRPPQLQDGLLVALQDLARRSPVRIDLDLPDRRLVPELEDAVYFITCEAITNAIKHGSPSQVVVRGTHLDGWLQVSVSDDGPGGARSGSDGGGLSGMMDRARAHGGAVTVDSRPQAGTTVRLMLPLAFGETALTPG